MKKLPLKAKIVICLLVLLAAIAMIFSITYWPSPTAEIAFRRMEKQHLIGPAQIIGTEDIRSYYDHMIVGASEYGYTVFTWYGPANWDQGDLSYFPKQDEVTLFLPLELYTITVHNDSWLPVMVFTDDSSAARAHLTLQLNDGSTAETFEAEAVCTDGGYFLFRFGEDVISSRSLTKLLYALSDSYITDSTVTASITFYDRSGHAQSTYSPQIHTPT